MRRRAPWIIGVIVGVAVLGGGLFIRSIQTTRAEVALLEARAHELQLPRESRWPIPGGTEDRNLIPLNAADVHAQIEAGEFAALDALLRGRYAEAPTPSGQFLNSEERELRERRWDLLEAIVARAISEPRCLSRALESFRFAAALDAVGRTPGHLRHAWDELSPTLVECAYDATADERAEVAELLVQLSELESPRVHLWLNVVVDLGMRFPTLADVNEGVGWYFDAEFDEQRALFAEDLELADALVDGTPMASLPPNLRERDVMANELPRRECEQLRLRLLAGVLSTYGSNERVIYDPRGGALRRRGPNLVSDYNPDYCNLTELPLMDDRVPVRVASVVRGRWAEVLACRSVSLVRGRVRTNIRLTAEGASVEVVANETNDPELPGCLQEAASTWRFPRPAEAQTLSYDFDFGRVPVL